MLRNITEMKGVVTEMGYAGIKEERFNAGNQVQAGLFRRALTNGFSGGGGLRTADDRGVAADEAEGVLVEDGRHRFVQFGQFVPELNGALEEDFDGYGPKFVIIGGGVVPQQVFGGGFALHGGEDGAGDFGKIGEFLFEMLVFFRLGDVVDISQGMRHFMYSYVAIGRLARDALDEIIPGEVNAGLVYMAHERAGVESIMVVIP
jgi:hypothetical protein